MRQVFLVKTKEENRVENSSLEEIIKFLNKTILEKK